MSVNPNQLATQQAQVQAMLAAQRVQNRQFMAYSINKEVLCQQANGGANSQAYVTGQPLTYNITTSNNGFLVGFWIRVQLAVVLAAGTSAFYSNTAGYPINVLDSVVVNYGQTQHNFRPYMLKYYSQLLGQVHQSQPRTILAGTANANLDTYWSNFPASSQNITGSGSPTKNINFAIYVPMNMLHPQDVRGILPIQNGETTCQVIINCAGALYGNDAILNAYAIGTGAGTGQAVTVTAGTTSQVSVIAIYKDGQSFRQLNAVQPNMQGIETIQFVRDVPLVNLAALQIFSGKVSFLHKIPYLFLTVLDGIQTSSFALTSNIQLIQTSADATANRIFYRYGLNTNMDLREWYSDLTGAQGGLLQQNLDEGIFPLVYGPQFQQSDAGILEGQHYLDMTTTSGWTDFHYGLQLATVGTNGTPRVEVHAILLNDPLVI
jgi:hypothetical protein